MKNLIISLEATCDLPKNIIEEYNLSVANMEFMIEDEIYTTEKDDVVSSDLYKRMREGKKTKTSQINEENYYQYFKGLVSSGKKVLHLAFSSGQSSTYFSAKKAAERVNEEKKQKLVYVVDSLCACSGQGFYGILVKEFADKNENLDKIVSYAEKLKRKIAHSFSVDDLKYHYRGGRIKQSKAIIGSLLGIKPVLRVDDEGRLVQMKNVMSRKKALRTIFDVYENSRDKNFDEVFISHADCLKDAETLAGFIKGKYGITPLITDLGPIIGCHSGPGTIALFFVASNR